MLPVKRFSLHNEMKSQIHSLKQFGQEKKLDQTEFENSQPEKADTLNSSHRKKSVSLMRFISHENDQLISLQEAQQILNLFFNNQFDKADNLTEKFLQFQSNVLYIKFVRAIGAFVQAVVIQDKVSFFFWTHTVCITHTLQRFVSRFWCYSIPSEAFSLADSVVISLRGPLETVECFVLLTRKPQLKSQTCWSSSLRELLENSFLIRNLNKLILR